MLVLAIGFGMMALTVAIHTYGCTLWLNYIGHKLKEDKRNNRRPRLFHMISSSAAALLFLHVAEVLLWALLFMQLPGQDALSGLQPAFYLSMITFTTVGYGDITLVGEWQNLAGMEGMVGIVVFGLTTALLFAMIQKSWSYALTERGETK